MHPTAKILCWLILALSIQGLSGYGLAAGTLIALAQGHGMRRRWWSLVRRSRFLLLSLWLILAYSLPGDTWHDIPWLPSHPGILEASHHAGRLILLLASLAWLLEAFPPQGMMAGLWRLLRPLQALGLQVDRTVARLSLVFNYLENAPPKGSWRHLLDQAHEATDQATTIRLSLPLWQPRDTLSLGACLSLSLLLCLP